MTTQAASSSEGRKVLTAASQLPLGREQALWAKAIEELHASAANLEPAARISVRLVLESLVHDATETPETREDVRALLDVFDGAAVVREAA
jgi:hypothetical protein